MIKWLKKFIKNIYQDLTIIFVNSPIFFLHNFKIKEGTISILALNIYKF